MSERQLLTVGVVALLACSSGGSAPDEPVLAVEFEGTRLVSGARPSAASGTGFGVVGLSAQAPIEHIFTIANVGKSPLSVAALEVEAGAGEFFAQAAVPATLAPQQIVSLTIGFAPAAEGERLGRVRIRSNGGDLALELRGDGGAAHVALLGLSDAVIAPGAAPSAASGTDFGAIRAGGRARRTFRIINTGQDVLTLGAPTLSGAAGFELAPAVSTVAPDEVATLVVEFAPAAVGLAEAVVLVPNDSVDHPALALAVRGRAVTGAGKLFALRVPGLHSAWPWDWDGDGDLDVFGAVWGSGFRNVVYRIYLNDGTGAFTDATLAVLGSEAATENVPRHAIFGDLTGDGRDDLVIASHGQEADGPKGGQSLVFVPDGAGHVADATAALFPAEIAFTHDAAVGDADGDGDLDVYLSNIWGWTQVGPRLLVNPGDGSRFTGYGDRVPADMVSLVHKFTASRFLDVDRDGDQDLVLGFHGNTVPDARDTVLVNDGTGRFDYGLPLALPPRRGGPDMENDDIALGDLDGNGFLDLSSVLVKSVDGVVVSTVQVCLNQGDGTFVDGSTGLPADFSAYKLFDWAGVNATQIVDFDQDGRPDLLVDGNATRPVVFAQASDGSFSVARVFDETTLGIGVPFRAMAGDFDGDHVVDVVFTYP